MGCLGLEPGAAEWKAQMNPLSYGGTPFFSILNLCSEHSQSRSLETLVLIADKKLQ